MTACTNCRRMTLARGGVCPECRAVDRRAYQQNRGETQRVETKLAALDARGRRPLPTSAVRSVRR